jgi:hypothetical protein
MIRLQHNLRISAMRTLSRSLKTAVEHDETTFAWDRWRSKRGAGIA